MLKKSLTFLLLILVILGSVYTVLWHYYAQIIDREISAFTEEQKESGIFFDGVMSKAHGFPGVYKIVYTGDIRTPSGKINLPKLELSGIPLEGQKILVKAPLGLSLDARGIPAHLKVLEQAHLVFVIPTQMPPEFTHPYVKVWQERGHANISIPSISLQWPDASIVAEVSGFLNDELQPEGMATLGVTNHNFFVTILTEELGMRGNIKLMLLGFLNTIDKSNGAVVLPFRMEKRGIYLNMIRLGDPPIIHWPRTTFSGRKRPENSPAPAQ